MPATSTPDQLAAFLGALKAHQHVLIDEAAVGGGVPGRSDLRDIADLENTIAAVIALIEERTA